MIVGADDVRRLLESDADGATLVIQEGRAQVVAAVDLESDAHRGALWVTTRDELLGHTGRAELSQAELEEYAAKLDTGPAQLGG